MYDKMFIFCITICFTIRGSLSSTFTIRIPEELKKKMKEFKVEWSVEVRGFIEERIRQLELMKLIKEVELRSERRRVGVNSAEMIREDRER